MTKEGDLIAGVIMTQMILIRLLDAKGVLSKQDFINACQQWMHGTPPEKQTSMLYFPLQLLVQRLVEDSAGTES